ncbi:3-oxoacyl-ACP synthase III family protein [Peterkaempfera bronchialis]|uniref:3-oxoacyl-ACP synthase III family protein n=1 Tax=Peterkaempfera bronchialis TaxID=2126346 RepID=UPI003C2E601D
MTPAGAARHARVAEVATHLPEDGMTSAQVEARLAELNPGLVPPPGLIERLTGVRYRHLAPDDWMASDLAAAAVRKLLDSCGRDLADIDLLIFAATSADVIEPATAHIVAEKLGARCPVFDLSNACNSVVNAIEVADALICAGHYDRILIACGERVTLAAQWRLSGLDELFTVGASHTVSDAGAALLLEASDRPGVLAHRFTAESAAWPTTVVPVQRDRQTGVLTAGRFQVRSMELLAALDRADLTPLLDAVTGLGMTMADFAVVCVHQAALPYLAPFCERAGIPLDRTVVTIADHGNVASASLPLQLVTAVETGRLKRGDHALLIGLASGLSLGAMVLRW